MIPFMLSPEEENCPEIRGRYSQHFFVAENPMMLFSGAEDHTGDSAEEGDEMEESEESEESESSGNTGVETESPDESDGVLE